MWPPWGRPSPRIHSASTNPSFTCSSFKDVPLLCSADDNSSTDSPYRVQVLNRHRQLTAKNIFHRVRLASSLLRNWPSSKPEPQTLAESNDSAPEQIEQFPRISLPGTEHRIVVYYTSLRVVRRTFDACRSVQSILDGFRIAVDERDVSMYPGFLEELRQILGICKEKLTLPKVFVGGRFIGGAEEVWQLYETGELKKLVEELPAVKPRVCDACGGYRFVLCGDCNGSHKVYSDKAGFRSCTACSDDGLIKCPTCYPTALAPR